MIRKQRGYTWAQGRTIARAEVVGRSHMPPSCRPLCGPPRRHQDHPPSAPAGLGTSRIGLVLLPQLEVDALASDSASKQTA
jgi:hypothetical protein